MVYLVHGYIDVFNNESKYNKSKKPKLVTKTNDIVFEQDGQYSYNSKAFVDKIEEKILLKYNNENSDFKEVKLHRSLLKFTPKNETHFGGTYHEHDFKFKIKPFEDTAQITLEEFNIIVSFKNEITCTRRDYIRNKKYTFEENQVKLITLPQHCMNISLKGCKNYNEFKKIIFEAIYNDITSLMIDELRRTNFPKWEVSLSETGLDIRNIINDNLKLLTA